MIENNKECYVDEVGGFHSPGECYNPKGHFCGECGALTCKDCPYSNLEEEDK